MNHMEHTFQDLPFLHRESPKKHNQFCHFRHRGGTHFLVLAQTLMSTKNQAVKNGFHLTVSVDYTR